jgi:hypothetical protein
MLVFANLWILNISSQSVSRIGDLSLHAVLSSSSYLLYMVGDYDMFCESARS